jgi:hypothetical protein
MKNEMRSKLPAIEIAIELARMLYGDLQSKPTKNFENFEVSRFPRIEVSGLQGMYFLRFRGMKVSGSQNSGF